MCQLFIQRWFFMCLDFLNRRSVYKKRKKDTQKSSLVILYLTAWMFVWIWMLWNPRRFSKTPLRHAINIISCSYDKSLRVVRQSFRRREYWCFGRKINYLFTLSRDFEMWLFFVHGKKFRKDFQIFCVVCVFLAGHYSPIRIWKYFESMLEAIVSLSPSQMWQRAISKVFAFNRERLFFC